MSRNAPSLSNRLRSFDAYAKTLDDFSVKTISGAAVTIVSTLIILTLLVSEFSDYRSVELRPRLVVDKSRGEMMTINVNVTFPHAPCFLLNMDVMDATGEQEASVDHDIYKVRLDPLGNRITEDRESYRGGEKVAKVGNALANTDKDGYCGSCYGGKHPDGLSCCNTCDDVRRAYNSMGWAFANPDDFEQCVKEHWKENLLKQAKEGCIIHGSLKVKKVSGNFHIMAGQSAIHNNVHIHTIYSYMPDDYDFSHTINHLSFGSTYPNMINPLDRATKVAPVRDLQYQYFLKVVGTEVHYLSKPDIISNQYSVTEHAKRLLSFPFSGGNTGVFFNYEISPMRVIYAENRKSLSHFLTSLCAIVGGIFTVAGIVDAFIYRAETVLRKKVELGKQF
ncbi:ER-derived vesicles protein erv46 [Tieghemiomyces parasiticus]|uniref:ER-derived vesicles protein erv46 n=1 Tax=Tieghemiomyces parasiticus TaxID=78921 RepID=A0A9W8AFN5_9FUNG|nr:ER-derived vesicles protein erv46 [Tieghemiomyces parasiticus]